DRESDADLLQLAVAGNLLVRTTRDHKKQVWYRQEIEAILLENDVETQTNNGEGGPSVGAGLYHLLLVVRLANGERTTIARWDANYPLTDYRPRAELEWVATRLRQALFHTTTEPAPTRDDRLAHAVQVTTDSGDKTRITREP